MNNELTTNQLTPELAKQKLSIALTQGQLLIQSLQTEADLIPANEDGLQAMADLLQKAKKATKVINDHHAIIKKPYWDSCVAADTAKRDMISAIDGATEKVARTYKTICDNIAKRKREEDERKAKTEAILKGVESNILDFSTRIASCTTRKELTAVESLINLEKSTSRATKYGEHHQYAIDKYNEVLLPILKQQKVSIEQKEALVIQIDNSNDPDKIDELKAELDKKTNEIIDNSVRVQENALNANVSQTVTAEELFPQIKKQGSNILCEIVDEKKAFQKQRHLLDVSIKLSDAKKLGATLRDTGAFGHNDTVIVDGIKFTLETKWKV